MVFFCKATLTIFVVGFIIIKRRVFFKKINKSCISGCHFNFNFNIFLCISCLETFKNRKNNFVKDLNSSFVIGHADAFDRMKI